MNNLTAIVVEDNSSLRHQRLKELKATGGVFVGTCGREAAALVERIRPASVIIGETTQHAWAELLWQHHLHPEIPFLLLRSQNSNKEEWLLEIEAAHWGVRILKAEEIFELIPKLKQAEDEAAAATKEVEGGPSLEGPLPYTVREILPEQPLPLSAGPQNHGPKSNPTRFPGYLTLKSIGRGGFGEVYLVRNQVSGNLFAVKVVWEVNQSERERDAVRIYQRLSLRHRGCLAPIYHVGPVDGDPCNGIWYVTEPADDRVNGREINAEAYSPRTLQSELLSRGKLRLSDCKKTIKSLLRQVSILHQHGLVHADIKPSNVIYFNGDPLLIDISLLDHVSFNLSPNGTKGFRPPEGHGLPTGDVYSLGRLLYETATGTSGAAGGHSFLKGTLEMQKLGAIIQKACAGNPRHRYQTAEEMLEDVNRL